MRPTIRAISEAAGVSAMAVSAVLNGAGSNVKVSVEKAELIRRIARDLRYQPNHVARSLRTRRTHMVGVVFQEFGRLGEHSPYHTQLLNGVMSALFPANYTLALCPRLIVGGQAESISDGRFDGVLWCRPIVDEESLATIQSASVPVVVMHAPPGAVPGVATFCADNDRAMLQVVDHLKALGHRRVAFVIEPLNMASAEGRARRDAFTDAGNTAGLETDTLLWDEDCSQLAEFASRPDRHTAIVCFSDTQAGRVLQVARRIGLGVPTELSVVGFDSSSFCEGTTPRLTSIRQPVEHMAVVATNHLLTLIRERIDGLPPTPTVSSLYDCGLDVRESTAPPASTRPKLIEEKL